MTRIAISGHRGLPPEVEALVDQQIRTELTFYDPATLTGITCLADGADQIFARAICDHGATLEVVVPAAEYRDGLPAEAQPTYDQLLQQATIVERLDHHASTATAHMDASTHMLHRADLLFAVWDGQPARGYGGTADVVAHAHQLAVPVTVIWPDGATRD